MKTLKEYIMLKKKTYPFKVKVAGEITSEQEDTMRALLDKYQVVEFKKTGRTPVQALPLDFPRMQNAEVNIYDVVLDYPVTSHELSNYIGNGLKITEQRIVIRNPNEPSEEYQARSGTYEGALLDDATYKESPNADFNDYYGDKYNMSFVKALRDDLKAQMASRGEVRVQETGQTTNDLPQGTRSPIAQTTHDPRKK